MLSEPWHPPRGSKPKGASTGWCRIVCPSESACANVYFKYETHTEFTELKPSQMHGVQSLVQLHFPLLDAIYHGATFMVVWTILLARSSR